MFGPKHILEWHRDEAYNLLFSRKIFPLIMAYGNYALFWPQKHPFHPPPPEWNQHVIWSLRQYCKIRDYWSKGHGIINWVYYQQAQTKVFFIKIYTFIIWVRSLSIQGIAKLLCEFRLKGFGLNVVTSLRRFLVSKLTLMRQMRTQHTRWRHDLTYQKTKTKTKTKIVK